MNSTTIYSRPRSKSASGLLRRALQLTLILAACALAVENVQAAKSPITFVPTVRTLAGGASPDPKMPTGIAADGAGNIYFSDDSDCQVERIDSSTGAVSTVAGNGKCGYSGDGGSASEAELNYPTGLAFTPAGDLLIADRTSVRVVNLSTSIISSFASNDAGSSSNSCQSEHAAQTSSPFGITADAMGNVYFTDVVNNNVCRIDAVTHVISTVTGITVAASLPSVVLTHPSGIISDGSNNLYITDGRENLVARYSISSATVTIIAGTGMAGFSGDGGQGTQAQLNAPSALAFDPSRNLLIADQINGRIRELNLTTGIITTIAGDGKPFAGSSAGTPAIAASMIPIGLATDPAGNILVADIDDSSIFEIGIISHFGPTAVGSTRQLQFAFIASALVENVSATVASNIPPVPLSTFYNISGGFTCSNGITATKVTLLEAGDWCTIPIQFSPTQSGILPGLLTLRAGSSAPTTLALDGEGAQGSLLAQPAAAEAMLPASALSASGYANFSPTGIASDALGNVFVADSAEGVVFYLTNANGAIQAVPGPGSNPSGNLGDGGLASAATLQFPLALVFDRAENLYISDLLDSRIRRVTFPSANIANGVISTAVGNGSYGYAGDGGPANQAEISTPAGMAFDSLGNLYFADSENQVIRKVNTQGVISTVAGKGVAGYVGDKGPATAAELNYPYGVAVDEMGNLYIADTNNNVIRKVSNSGVITTVAGNTTSGFTGDGGAATAAELNSPTAVATDPAGNLYISDTNNGVIRMLALDGTISTIAGVPPGAQPGPSNLTTGVGLSTPVGIAVTRGTGTNLGLGYVDQIAVADPGSATLWSIQPNVSSVTFSEAGLPEPVLIYNTGGAQAELNPPFSLPEGLSFGNNTLNQINLPSGSNQTLDLTFVPQNSSATLPAGISIPTNADVQSLTIHLTDNVGVTKAIPFLVIFPVLDAPQPGTSQVIHVSVVTPVGSPAATGVLYYSYTAPESTTPVTGSITLPTSSFTIPNLIAGSYTITANYSGDSYYDAEYQSSVFNVQKVTPTLTMTASPSPASTVTGNSTVSFTFGNLISSILPHGTLTLTDTINNTSTTHSLNVTSANLTLLLTGLQTGTHTLSASYADDQNYNPTSATAILVVSTSTPQLTVSAQPAGATTNATGAQVSVALSSGSGASSSSSPNGSVWGSTDSITGTVSITITDPGSSVPWTKSYPVVPSLSVPLPPTGSLVAGTYKIEAKYSGDSNFNSTTASTTYTVGKQATILSITPAVSQVSLGMSDVVSFSLGLPPNAIAPTGSVTYTVLQKGTVGASTTITLPAPLSFTFHATALGNFAVEANYSGDGNYTPSTAIYHLTVNKIVPTLAVSPQNAPYALDHPSPPVDLVLAGTSGSFPPTGEITYSYTVTGLGSQGVLKSGNGMIPLTGTTPSFKLGTIIGGTYNITANYGGDANYASVSDTIRFHITPQAVTLQYRLGTNPLTAVPEIQFTFAHTNSNWQPIGSVNYSYIPPGSSRTVNGFVPIPNNSLIPAALELNTFPAGNYTLTATYSGDDFNAPGTVYIKLSIAREAPSITVNPAIAAPSTSDVNDTITVNFVQSSTSIGVPTGTLTYSYQVPGATSKTAGTLTLPNNTFQISGLVGGEYSIGVRYSGDSNYLPTSGSTIVNVSKSAPAVTVKASSNPGAAGLSDTATVEVSESATGYPPTGTISYSYLLPGNDIPVTGTVTLPSDTIALEKLVEGIYVISATYSGDARYASAKGVLDLPVD